MTTAKLDLSEQFRNAGGVIVTPEESAYPDTMNERTGYPTLSVLGNATVLSQQGIGLCGARGSSDSGLELARHVGRISADLGVALVSGYAKGVDSAGHVGAIEAGGLTIAVLAEGVGKFRLRPEYSGLIDPLEQMTIVSTFPLNARWTVINAMERNKTICSLSQVLVAIEPGERGGTLNAAQEALRQNSPVILVLSDDPVPPHVAKLMKRGADLARSRHELEDAIQHAYAPATELPPIGQGALFD